MNFFKKDRDSNDGDLYSQLHKISEHLGFLEKKIDTLLENNRRGGQNRFGGTSNQNRPFNNNNRRPRRFGSDNRPYTNHGNHGNRPNNGNRAPVRRDVSPREGAEPNIGNEAL